MLVLPNDVGKYAEVLDRWESITINHVNSRQWDSNQEKVNYIENLLGDVEKKMFIGWRMTYLADYNQMVTNAANVQNVTGQIKRMLVGIDPYDGTTEEQDRAYKDLERLPCDSMSNVHTFLHEYGRLAALSGRMWIDGELSNKFFRKLPPLIGKQVEEAFVAKYPQNQVGVMMRINFTYHYIANLCRQALIQKSLKDLTFCNTISIPGYDNPYRKKYGLRKSRTYEGKPHRTHVKLIRQRDKDKRTTKCKCYICGREGHFARECRSKEGRLDRANIYKEMEIPKDWDVISVGMDEDDRDEICSLSDGEEVHQDESLLGITAGPSGLWEEKATNAMAHFANTAFTLLHDQAYEHSSSGTWLTLYDLPQLMKDCIHQWQETPQTEPKGVCSRCHFRVMDLRAHCELCNLIACGICLQRDYGIKIVQPEPERTFRDTNALIGYLYKHNAYLLREVERLKSLLAGQTTVDKGKALMEDMEDMITEFDMVNLYDIDSAYRAKNEEAVNEGAVQPKQVTKNMLYHINVRFEIQGGPTFKVPAIIDTGCTCCCINQEIVPEDALEEAGTYSNFYGINSVQVAKKRLKYGKMWINDYWFPIPYTYAMPMKANGIQMLIGCNFLRSMKGGIRFEGNTVTIYKSLTPIQTTGSITALWWTEQEEVCEELGWTPTDEAVLLQLEEEEVAKDGHQVTFNQDLINELKDQGYIGEGPLRHWKKNQVLCSLPIINPDLTIESRPLAQVTPEEADAFKRHVRGLLDLGVIRPSSSRHRTTAIIVRSGTTVDPKTGKETRGKERMVFDYRKLNANTHKDQYALPGINTIVSRVGRSKFFSKFDLKSGFHQVAMEETSIPWTAFVIPGGELYEWLVMPFGLKNAPAVFQRKMDNVFRGTEDYIAVYIDDILVFSNTLQEHELHVAQMLEICRKHGLVLSPTKMKLAQPEVDFLGVTIGANKIRLQEHIIKRIADVSITKLQSSTKELRSWLGVLNYARAHIPKCGTLLGPLYNKTSPNADKRWSRQEEALVARIKALVTRLPDLQLPPKEAHIIIESDGSMEGWGAVCKWTMTPGVKDREEICAYASGIYPHVKSTIDSEIFAVMMALEKFKIYYLDKREVTIRTDCGAIISFHNKLAANKPSRVRWIAFCDYITGSGVDVKFEHIKGTSNQLADHLSRLTKALALGGWQTEEFRAPLTSLVALLNHQPGQEGTPSAMALELFQGLQLCCELMEQRSSHSRLPSLGTNLNPTPISGLTAYILDSQEFSEDQDTIWPTVMSSSDSPPNAKGLYGTQSCGTMRTFAPWSDGTQNASPGMQEEVTTTPQTAGPKPSGHWTTWS
ncbi:hypothetical protein MLD38_020864 [Melastoma candidum]|nr:hypothetical protein MLD38_020864 [Melastoma candidum]